MSDLAEIVRTLDAEGLPIADLRLHSPTLDDVFLAKTGRSLEGAGRRGAGEEERAGERRARSARMNSVHAIQVGVLARRAMLKTLRQPFQLFPIVFFPLILLAVNASGLSAATRLPGFPTQLLHLLRDRGGVHPGRDVLADQHRHEPRRGHRERLLQSPRAHAAAAGVADRGPARGRGGARRAAVGRVHADGRWSRARIWRRASAARS